MKYSWEDGWCFQKYDNRIQMFAAGFAFNERISFADSKERPSFSDKKL
jgi:hypothetical protein